MNMFAKRRQAAEKKRSDANNQILGDIASQLEK
jgi:hypothetical protein